ncbi:MAG: hypothetical protein JWQ57_4959 [Mucilaginibacter sp.]|nr:hypothetical protein [Mucilaginibacter sp.]
MFLINNKALLKSYNHFNVCNKSVTTFIGDGRSTINVY